MISDNTEECSSCYNIIKKGDTCYQVKDFYDGKYHIRKECQECRDKAIAHYESEQQEC